MSMALQAEVKALRAEVKELREALDGFSRIIAEPRPSNPNGPRTMCPKCKKEPAYYLHVRSCKG